MRKDPEAHTVAYERRATGDALDSVGGHGTVP